MQANPRILFSSHPARGKKTRKIEKYNTDATWPIIMKGFSTGIPPIQVRMATSAINVQKRNCEIGRKVKLRCLEEWRRGTNMSTKIDASNARTPPSLLGIERRIA